MGIGIERETRASGGLVGANATSSRRSSHWLFRCQLLALTSILPALHLLSRRCRRRRRRRRWSLLRRRK